MDSQRLPVNTLDEMSNSEQVGRCDLTTEAVLSHIVTSIKMDRCNVTYALDRVNPRGMHQGMDGSLKHVQDKHSNLSRKGGLLTPTMHT